MDKRTGGESERQTERQAGSTPTIQPIMNLQICNAQLTVKYFPSISSANNLCKTLLIFTLLFKPSRSFCV
jgi:hypothetical protein